MANLPVIQLDHRHFLQLEDIRRVARGEATLELNVETADLLDLRRNEIIDHIHRLKEPAYGFNRGFGHNVDLKVDDDDTLLGKLQLNLIRSHSAAIGDPAPTEVVRTAMVLRANSLARGYSGIRSVVVKTMLQLLNAGIVPVVPRHGSVSASGDLAPLSHMALALIGEGQVEYKGEYQPAAAALKAEAISPLVLEMKEGLALNNGVQYLTALGIYSAEKMTDMLRTAVIATTLSTQVMLGSSTPFRKDLHQLRPHRGSRAVANWLWKLLQDAPIQKVHQDKSLDGEVQDPYNIRCAAQILGSCFDLILEAEECFTIEANSVTDNPLILPDEDGKFTDVVSGGHFHGMPVAIKVYGLIQAAAIIARLSNTRCARYVDEKRNKGLGSDLIWPDLSPQERSTSSGMMAAEYTSASLTNWLWGQTMPSHLFSLSTDAGQEDHVSMGAPLALRLLDSIPRLAEVLAVELAFASQAAAIRKAQPHFPSKSEIPEEALHLRDKFVEGLRKTIGSEGGRNVDLDVHIHKLYAWKPEERLLSPASERVLERIQSVFPAVKADRILSDDISKIASLVLSGQIVRETEKEDSIEWSY
jgi:histidine ammonia-lyase